MAKYLRYKGEFLSRAGIVWRVEILQEAARAFRTVGELTFPADSPLVISWKGTEKHEPMCGSTAELRIESPGDRTYIDLYTEKPGDIRMDVYREGALYWRGALDPEFYEEPYERADKYDVSLLFSDFGILERLEYEGRGIRTMREIVDECLDHAGLPANTEADNIISTMLPEQAHTLRLSELSVDSENFYDEDGEPMTLTEVLTGILQPLSLRMVQRQGHIIIYDLNALCSTRPEAVAWSGESQTLGVDTVYNKAKVTWSPYTVDCELNDTTAWDGDIDETKISLMKLSGGTYNNAKYYSYPVEDYYTTEDTPGGVDGKGGVASFTLWTSTEHIGSGITAAGDNDAPTVFKIVPQFDGQEKEGVLIGSRIPYLDSSGNYKEKALGNIRFYQGLPVVPALTKHFATQKVYLPPATGKDMPLLRITMEMLCDPRINPNEDAMRRNADYDDREAYEEAEKYANFVYVPICVFFQPNGSNDVYMWNNDATVRNTNVGKKSAPVPTIASTYGIWEKPDTTSIPNTYSKCGYLCYYQPSSREKSGILGWKTNRQAIPPTLGRIPVTIEKTDAGQRLYYPGDANGAPDKETAALLRNGGTLWVEIPVSGWGIVKAGRAVNDQGTGDIFWGTKLKHTLVCVPKIEIVSNDPYDSSLDSDDVEYNAVINENAKEDIGIDTICGSSVDGVLAARGTYYRSDNLGPIRTLYRAGRTKEVEELLLGTLFSQYAERHTKISGEAEIIGKALSVTEQNQGDKIFLITEQVQDIITDCGDTTIVELRPDEYTKDNE